MPFYLGRCGPYQLTFSQEKKALVFYLPPDFRAGSRWIRVYSAMVFAGGLGSISFPYAFGPAAHAFGFRTAMALVALPAAFVTLLAAYVPRTAKRA